MQGGWLLMTIG